MQLSTAMYGRRRMLAASAVQCASPLVAWAAAGPLVEVWKDPSCGCCKDWVSHLSANGFEVKAHETGNAAVRKELGMPDRYGSCHTARVGGYAIEGHVPAREVHRLLKEKPAALGRAGHAHRLPRHGWPGVWQTPRCLPGAAGQARWQLCSFSILSLIPLKGTS